MATLAIGGKFLRVKNRKQAHQIARGYFSAGGKVAMYKTRKRQVFWHK